MHFEKKNLAKVRPGDTDMSRLHGTFEIQLIIVYMP